MSLLCLDGVVPEAIPSSELALGYVDGDYQTYGELVKLGRHKLVIPVTATSADPTAILADVETGDLTPRRAAFWALNRLNRGKRPAVYGTLDSIDDVKRALRQLRVRVTLCDYFLADWTIVGEAFAEIRTDRHVPIGNCGWQFAGNLHVPGGHIIDASVVTTDFATRHGWSR